MKNRHWDCSRATLGVMMAGVLLVIGSWAGSLQELPVRNMLSPEGIRWFLQSIAVAHTVCLGPRVGSVA